MNRLIYFSFCLLALQSYTGSFCQSIKGNFAIKNQATGLLLRPLDANKKNETPIVGYDPTNWKCMTWDFKEISANTYQLRNLFTNKTFEPSTMAAEGVQLKQQSITASNVSQQWEFIPAAEETYLIKLKGTDLYVTASKDEINSHIILSKKKKDKTQHWTIYEQDPLY